MKKISLFIVFILLCGLCLFCYEEGFLKNEIEEIQTLFDFSGKTTERAEEKVTERDGCTENTYAIKDETENISKDITEKTECAKSSVLTEEVRGVWITYTEISKYVKGKTENEYTESLENIFENLKKGKINNVYYQCRAFCDSLYSSDIFPVSAYLLESGQEELSYDPFSIFIRISKEYGIKVHCWVNPFRVGYKSSLESVSEKSPVHRLYKQNKDALIICDKGIFLNPSCADARKLILSGIKELLNKYEVDGLHFDDYFYPETAKINDSKLYSQYKSQGGGLSLKQWRRENISTFVSSVYSVVKGVDENILFGISPCADIKKCTDVFYADVEKWCKNDGYIDYIIPQIYFGFQNETMPFLKVMKQWEKLSEGSNVAFICGMASYKCGETDENAGVGKNEWKENVNILSRQYELMAKRQVWRGFSLFSYSFSFGENMNENSKIEIRNLVNMIK